MTKDKVFKLIEDNGLTLHGDIEHFAHLVAEEERNECIKIVMEGTGEPVQTRTLEIINQERERIVEAIEAKLKEKNT